MEIAPHQRQPVIELADGLDWVDVVVHADLSGRDRIVIARRAPG